MCTAPGFRWSDRLTSGTFAPSWSLCLSADRGGSPCPVLTSVDLILIRVRDLALHPGFLGGYRSSGPRCSVGTPHSGGVQNSDFDRLWGGSLDLSTATADLNLLCYNHLATGSIRTINRNSIVVDAIGKTCCVERCRICAGLPYTLSLLEDLNTLSVEHCQNNLA
jgi:hypothetical protein